MVFSGFVGSKRRVDREFNSLHNCAASTLSLFFVAVYYDCMNKRGQERGKAVLVKGGMSDR